jgi:hypothetical protein
VSLGHRLWFGSGWSDSISRFHAIYFSESSDDDDTHEELELSALAALKYGFDHCDALWRPQDLSARGYRRAHWAYLQPKMRRASTQEIARQLLAKRTNGLIDFIEALQSKI